MNLKRTFFTGLAAVGLMASVAAPMVSAQDDNTANNQAEAKITLTENGVFDVTFTSDLNFATQNTNASAGSTATGGIGLAYTDTKSLRSEFRTSISADDFESSIQVPYQSAGTFYQIDASGFEITQTGTVFQTQCTGNFVNCPAPAHGYRVGDIGYYNGNLARNSNGSLWSQSTGSLDTPRYVNYGWEGQGTVDALSLISVELNVPAGMPAGTYVSDMTVSVTFMAP